MTGVIPALLPPLTVVKTVDYEVIVAEIAASAGVENNSPADPAYRVVLACAYREMLIRQEMNEQAKGLTLAHAFGSQLDHIGVTYYRNPDGSPILRRAGELDDDYRARLQESPEGLSVAGPEGAYRFHARNASQEVKDVSVDSPQPCEIDLFVLGRTGDGQAGPGLLQAVDTYLKPFRPFGDRVRVRSAEIVRYALNATVFVSSELDPAMALEVAEKRVKAYVAQMHKLGGQVVRSAVDAALTVEGVTEVVLNGWQDIRCVKSQAPYCYDVVLRPGG
ncbi:baseplate J/gp47 family protein [Pseudomonas sp. Irchel s3b2]|uniref:baseplate assembly protein n=1 Tax=Pseudomonas sp. Irchel s3b2 TaxID=2009073 RepID=UPI000BA471E8|nr:baseplate J/gp47 family protein [Pseudomonas sp. Irchel s3b2]